MLSRTSRLAAALTIAAGLVGAGAAVSPAAACEGGGIACAPPETPSADGNTVTVTVYGTMVSGGSPGSSGTRTTSVVVPTPCIWFRGWTGKEYAEGIDDGTINGGGSRDAENGTWEPAPGYQQHQDDVEGHWYYPGCRMLDGIFDSYAEFSRYTQDFFDDNPQVFIPGGGTPPVPDVPPEVLLLAAQEAMEMPEPVFDYNPRRTGDAATLVNLDTWFWLEDDTEEGEVTATAGANSVTVDAALQDVTFVGDNAGAVTCTDPGVEWTPGADSSCLLQFIRAGSNGVTASSTWGLTWSYNGTPQGTLDALGATWTTDINTVESQALVTQVD
ncbi:MAG: hypothetical protein WBQ50_05200 [Nocardioides sp.]